MKNLIEWTEELGVGIQEIDEQHKVLVELVNRLYKSIIRQTDSTVVDEVLTELIQYTRIHFAVEESLMRIFDYPLYEEHKQVHEELTHQVVELHHKFKKGEVAIGMELLSFLRRWLTGHIMVEDKKYTPFFLQKGLKAAWDKRSWVGRIWSKIT